MIIPEVIVEKETPTPHRLLSIREAAQVLGKSKWTLYRWCNAGAIPCRKVGGSWVLMESQVIRFLAGRGIEEPDADGG
jgi:excisionase family DNA binding protein